MVHRRAHGVGRGRSPQDRLRDLCGDLSSWLRARGAFTVLVLGAGTACRGGSETIDAQRARLGESIAFFEQRLDRQPDDVLVPSVLADRYLMRFGTERDIADVGRAERTLSQGLAYHPRYAAFLSRLVAVHIARHEFPEALHAAVAAYEAAPRRAANGRLFDAYFETGAYDSALVALRRMDTHTFGFLIRKARFAEVTGHPEVAAYTLARACQPDRIRVASLRAWCAVRRGDAAVTARRFRDAQRLFREALATAPDDPAAQSGLAALAVLRGDLHEAERRYTLVAAGPGGTVALPDLARIAERRGDRKGAHELRARFERKATDPRSGRAYWALLARVYAETGRAAEALDLARRDLAQRPGPEAYHTLGTVLFRLGRLTEAQDAVETALRWSPLDAELVALRDSISTSSAE